MTATIKPLLTSIYNSADSAYMVDDYPYGFRLRCHIRYWVEYRKGMGFRFVSQTSNPKKAGLIWNKPKASTYHLFPIAMYLDDKGHVCYASCKTWATSIELSDWIAQYGACLSPTLCNSLETFAKRKAAKEAEAANNPQ